MRSSASITIIGAGIVGCSAAYFLSKLGATDIVVVDAGPLFATGGSTSHAPGLVFQTNPSKTMTNLSQETVRTYASLELDGEPCWHAVGSMEVASTPRRMEDLKRRLGFARSYGLEASLLSPQEAAEKVPLLDPTKILGAYWVPSDGLAKAVRACESMAREAQAAGVAFYGRTPVTGIDVADGRVQAVMTPNGTIKTERVLICAGIWGPKVGRMAGIEIPLMPVEHQMTWTSPLPELAGESREIVHPILRHQDKDLYFRQWFDGYGVGSYQHEPRLGDADDIRKHGEPDDEPAANPFVVADFAPAWEDACELLPSLRGTTVVNAYNGMFSFTPDAFPVLGESAQVKACWVAEAVWITHGAGAGRAIAELMTHGKAWVDLREADINRFEPHQSTRAYIRARGAQQYREVYDVIHPLQPMDEPRPLRRTAFYERERELGAVFFEGRGWEQPRWYEANAPLLERFDLPTCSGWEAEFWSPVAGAEHLATRNGVALFDMSALPKIDVTGPGALGLLQRLTTNQLDKPVGSVTYTLILDKTGGIKSDVTVVRLAKDRFQLGANGLLDLAWLRRNRPDDGSVEVRDVTGALACIGLWGPKARDVIRRVSGADFGNVAFPYFSARTIEIGEVPVTALRVSYVGELGWELYVPVEFGARVWDLLWDAGQSEGIIAAGRAAFDTLRIEKGYRLWGVDMHTEYDPYEAGLGWAVKLEKGDFVGRDALLERKDRGPARILSCIRLADPGVVVMGKEPIWAGGAVVGYVTSAGYGFTTGRGIAYGYLHSGLAGRAGHSPGNRVLRPLPESNRGERSAVRSERTTAARVTSELRRQAFRQSSVAPFTHFPLDSSLW
jgi:glycine cleavage system aminomethyltransferase T/glycine/D-amino acid oxidase-like deaminating enzyme